MPNLKLLGLLLTLGPAGLVLTARQEPETATKPYPIVDYTWGRYEPDREDAVRQKLLEISAHLHANRPEVTFSVGTDYGLEQDRWAHLFVQAEDYTAVQAVWNASDPELIRLSDELVELCAEDGTTFLRQVAGEFEQGTRWAVSPFTRWEARVRFGKIGAALEAARQLTDHMNANYPELRVRAFVEFFDRADTIWWFVEVSQAGNWFHIERRLQEDETWLEILDSAADAFVADGFDDRWTAPL